MIHQISVSNYYSIRDELVLDLRIPKTAPNLPRFRQSHVRPDVRLPSVVVLMGPNGSGKTKLLRALHDVAYFASSLSTPRSDGPKTAVFAPFLIAERSLDPTRIWIDFEADWLSPGDGTDLFRYQLVVGVPPGSESRVVLHEALHHFPHRRPRRLLERRAPGATIEAAGELGFKTRDERLKAVRDDASLIATLAAFKVPLAERMQRWLLRVFVCGNPSHGEPMKHSTASVVGAIQHDSALATWVDNEIRRGDLGIEGVRALRMEDGGILAEFDHHGLRSAIPLILESNGTNRLFHLLPQLYWAFADGVPVVLDDFDSSLHVDMAGRILHYFHSLETNPTGAQLFAAAHNVGLLDELEKEELFIVEKDEWGVTRVHGAQDVHGLRRVNRLYPKYRSGVLGGVPRFG